MRRLRTGHGRGRALVAGLVVWGACASGSATGGADARSPAAVPIRDRFAWARVELLDAINADRRLAGMAPVLFDSLATAAAQAHAAAMAADGFFSHYGVLGDTPYERLARAGDMGHVAENVFRWETRALRPVGAADPWLGFEVLNAHRSLMGSPGHRATILDPHRTHVGLGIAADSTGGTVYVVQDFVARHVQLEPPRLAWHGSRTPLEGRLEDPGLRPLLVLLHREPADRAWVGREGPPPGPYADGSGEARIVPPWGIHWRRGPLSFEVDLGSVLREPGRWYGVVYVAPRLVVERAEATGAVTTEPGWPGAAFVVEVF